MVIVGTVVFWLIYCLDLQTVGALEHKQLTRALLSLAVILFIHKCFMLHFTAP